MTTTDEIARLAATGESETVEFKATTGQRTEAARTLSAMLNGRGGSVLFGVQPDGNVTGQQVGARTLDDVTQACQEIHPSYPPSIESVPAPNGSGRKVLVLVAAAGDVVLRSAPAPSGADWWWPSCRGGRRDPY